MTQSVATSTALFPVLRYRDADAAIEWLEGTIGCSLREIHKDEDGNVVHAELDFQGAVIMLSSAGVGREPFRSMPTGNGFVYAAIPDLDALHDQAVAAGAEVVLPLTDTDYGSRDFALRDPEHNLWSFGTYLPDTDN